MRLWTVQNIDFYNELIENQVICGNEKFVSNDFLGGYNWLLSKMEKMIGVRPNNSFPIWAWYQFESKTKPKPDLRQYGFLESGTNGVRLEIEKDETQVLLSDFELWHYPLSFKSYIGNSEKDMCEFENQLNQLGLTDTEFESLPIDIKQRIENSWDKIFDFNFDCDYFANTRDNKSIQGTFWELKYSEVKTIDFFKAR